MFFDFLVADFTRTNDYGLLDVDQRASEYNRLLKEKKRRKAILNFQRRKKFVRLSGAHSREQVAIIEGNGQSLWRKETMRFEVIAISSFLRHEGWLKKFKLNAWRIQT